MSHADPIPGAFIGILYTGIYFFLLSNLAMTAHLFYSREDTVHELEFQPGKSPYISVQFLLLALEFEGCSRSPKESFSCQKGHGHAATIYSS
jgi:hypothetical protein